MNAWDDAGARFELPGRHRSRSEEQSAESARGDGARDAWPDGEVFADDAYFGLSPDAQRAWIDERVAAELAESALTTSSFTPLPVLGVPGWWPEQDAVFYADTSVFRPKRVAP